MSNERYIALSADDWSEAVSRKRLDYSEGLLDLETASKMASGKATTNRRPYFLLKVVPVQLHKATVTLDVMPL